MDKILEKIGMRILGKRGQANRMWVEGLKSWEEMDPYSVREKTLMEIFNIVQECRQSLLKETPE